MLISRERECLKAIKGITEGGEFSKKRATRVAISRRMKVSTEYVEYLCRRLGSVRDDPPGLVDSFVFTSVSKSRLGWDFLAVIETGRFKDYTLDREGETEQFWREVEACKFEVLPGPGKRMRWGVDDVTVHDDFVISAALCAELDQMEWVEEVEGALISAPDYIEEVDRGGF